MSVARSFGRSVPIFSHDSGLVYSEVPAETILAEIQAKCQHSRLWQKSRQNVGQKSRFWLVGTTRNETDFTRFVTLRFFSLNFCTSSLWGFGGSQTSPKCLYRGFCAVCVCFLLTRPMLALRNHPDLSLAQFGTRDSHICTRFQTLKLRSASRADFARGNIDFEKIPLGGPRGSRPSKIPYENRLRGNLGRKSPIDFFRAFQIIFLPIPSGFGSARVFLSALAAQVWPQPHRR